MKHQPAPTFHRGWLPASRTNDNPSNAVPCAISQLPTGHSPSATEIHWQPHSTIHCIVALFLLLSPLSNSSLPRCPVMARSSEKAMALLNRFVAAKRDVDNPRTAQQQRRPHLASLVTELPEAEKWRRHTLRDISRLLSAIQNAAMGEHAIRDSNEQINKLLREKRHWERQIRALGGPDYDAEAGGRVKDADGRYAMGAAGGRRGAGQEYYYFGAAKDLPGVRELYEKRGREERKRGRGELAKLVDCQYYGMRDDEDGMLHRLERKAEKRQRKELENKWAQRQHGTAEADDGREDGADVVVGGLEDQLGMHIELPSKEQMEAAILAKKKQELLNKYKPVT